MKQASKVTWKKGVGGTVKAFQVQRDSRCLKENKPFKPRKTGSYKVGPLFYVSVVGEGLTML